MLARTLISVLAIVLIVAGCATRPRPNSAHIANWQDFETLRTPETNHVQASPSFASPPPAAPPVGKAPAKVVPYEKWVPIQRWSRSNGLAAPKRLSNSAPFTYALNFTNGVLTLSAGSTLAHWDGLELRLGFAPQQIDGQLYVHGLDLMKTIGPLLQDEPPGLNSNPILVIDPGHGGEDAGTRSVLGGHYEKEFTLDWALRLSALMQFKGWQVYLTRSNDMDLALSNRVQFASAHKAALFLSLHFNSAGTDTAESGLETYCLTPMGMPSSLTRGYADEIRESFPNNEFDAQNLQLALSVHRALLRVNGHSDRGVRHARFPGVLRNQQRPAILIEGGYLSNPSEARLISTAAYRQKLAEAVATGLQEYSPSTVHSLQSTVHGLQSGTRGAPTTGQGPEVTLHNSQAEESGQTVGKEINADEPDEESPQ